MILQSSRGAMGYQSIEEAELIAILCGPIKAVAEPGYFPSGGNYKYTYKYKESRGAYK